MRRVNFIDATGIHNLEIFIDSALKEHQTIILSGVNPDVREALEQSGIVDKIGRENVLDHIQKALARAEELNA
jgi:SulP family sulfate permease